MENIKKILRIKKANEIVNILNAKGYRAIHAESIEAAKELIFKLIPTGASIGLGGSVTLNELDIINSFRSEKYDLYDRYNQPDWPQTLECMRQALLADFFVTSTNVITKNGELIQTDSGGNRVASLVYGPKNVIVVAGVNKIVENLSEGLDRIKKYAAPLNSKRINHKTPCNISGNCENCMTKQRICNFTSVIKSGERMGDKITVIMISEEMGY